MKKALIFLAGSAVASSWWAAVLWGHKINDTDLSGLWIAPVLSTVATVMVAIMMAMDES
jgi:hypothetical protein